MIKIPFFVPPMELISLWKGGFTQEECDKIVKLCELAEFQKARMGDAGNTQVDLKYRDSDITWLMPSEKTHWVFERMANIASQLNHQVFELDLDRFDGFQYSKYKEGGHYDVHLDSSSMPDRNGLFRKLSFSLQLTDPAEYEGGELEISTDGRHTEMQKFKLAKGDMVVFYSHLAHAVRPVTKGTRKALVTWALGDKIR